MSLSWRNRSLREAFPYNNKYKYLLHDRDAKFGEAVNEAIAAIGLSAARTSFRSPYQNGVAERWVESCRRDLLDHVIPLNEKHLKRLLSEYVCHYHEDRTHLSLKKDTPASRKTAVMTPDSRIVSLPRVGGLHHRYDLTA